MNIWIVNHYASPPDQPLTSAFDMAKGLVGRGHSVTVFASGFSHYRFKELRLQPGEKWKCQEFEGVRFIWIRTRSYSGNDWRRVVNMLSFAWRAFARGRRMKENPDVIIGVTLHPLAALAAMLLSWVKRVPFVYEVRDLWPLTLIEFGRIEERSFTAWVMSKMEMFTARHAAQIVSTLPKAGEYFAERGIPRDRTTWIPNGIDLSRYEQIKRYEGTRSHPFKVMYAGGHVAASGLGFILRAAALLEAQWGQDVRFVFVGGGQEKPALMKLAEELRLQNVEWRDVVAKDRLPEILSEADAFILMVRHYPRLYQYGTSLNKLNDYLTAGRPIIFAGTLSYCPVREAQAGIVVPPEKPEAIVEGVNRLLDLPCEERIRMGTNARRYAKQHHDIRILTERMERLLASVVGEAKASKGPADRQTDNALLRRSRD